MDPIVISAIVGAAATVANLLISTFLWLTTRRATNLTQRIVESSNRPYIGIKELDCKEINGHKRVDIKFNNFGTVPAQDVWTEFKIFHNDKFIESHKTDPILAHQSFGFICTHQITDDVFLKLQNWMLDLRITVETHYKSLAGEEYVNRYVYQYAPEYGGFRIKSGSEKRVING